MIGKQAQIILWVLVLVQSVGLCRCLAQSVKPGSASPQIALDGSGDNHHGENPDLPAQPSACDEKVSVKFENTQSYLFIALLPSNAVDIIPPADWFQASPVNALLPVTPAHQGWNLPLLI